MHNSLTKTGISFLPAITNEDIAFLISIMISSVHIIRRIACCWFPVIVVLRSAAATRFIVSLCRDCWLLFVCGKEIKSLGDAIVWRWRVLRDRRGGPSVTSAVAGYRATVVDHDFDYAMRREENGKRWPRWLWCTADRWTGFSLLLGESLVRI